MKKLLLGLLAAITFISFGKIDFSHSFKDVSSEYTTNGSSDELPHKH